MFREMRRFKQQLSEEECRKVLTEERRGVLAVNGDDGYPYSVPVNFYYNPEKNWIVFHGAKVGHKVDSIRNNDKVCFTTWDKGYQKEDWSYYVNSVVVFGRAVLVENPEEVYEEAMKFGAKYFPTREELETEMKQSFHRTQFILLKIEHMTGKLVHEQ